MLGTNASRGFSFDATGGIKLSTGGLTSDPFGIVHGPYLISQEAKQIFAGDVVKFDWKSDGTSDAGSVFAYLLEETTGDTIILHDYTQGSAGATAWATKSTTVTTSGNYKFVFINGTYDATGGTVLGADFYVNNIIIEPYSSKCFSVYIHLFLKTLPAICFNFSLVSFVINFRSVIIAVSKQLFAGSFSS